MTEMLLAVVVSTGFALGPQVSTGPLSGPTTGPLSAPATAPTFTPQGGPQPWQQQGVPMPYNQPGAPFGPTPATPPPTTPPPPPSTAPVPPPQTSVESGEAVAAVSAAAEDVTVRQLDEENQTRHERLYEHFDARKKLLTESEEWKYGSRAERKARLRALQEEYRERQDWLRDDYRQKRDGLIKLERGG